jgi:hypothetical protein
MPCSCRRRETGDTEISSRWAIASGTSPRCQERGDVFVNASRPESGGAAGDLVSKAVIRSWS